ncbi:MAG: hypothetical protein H2045_00130 [Rhizobiales bacterium]|nr:hypothetical protein [Hyphomicrobiales bacterium]
MAEHDILNIQNADQTPQSLIRLDVQSNWHQAMVDLAAAGAFGQQPGADCGVGRCETFIVIGWGLWHLIVATFLN